MKRRAVALVGATAAGLVAIAALAQQRGGETRVEGLTVLGEPVTADEIALGQKFYATNCASCHGAKLEGQPAWKRRLDSGRMPAPPHDETGHTWTPADRQPFPTTNLGAGGLVHGSDNDMTA